MAQGSLATGLVEACNHHSCNQDVLKVWLTFFFGTAIHRSCWYWPGETSDMGLAPVVPSPSSSSD